MKATVGRIVHYWPPREIWSGEVPLAAIVTGLCEFAGIVDLTAFPPGGIPMPRCGVRQVEDGPTTEEGVWNWPVREQP